jgi:hypothetical protein
MDYGEYLRSAEFLVAGGLISAWGRKLFGGELSDEEGQSRFNKKRKALHKVIAAGVGPGGARDEGIRELIVSDYEVTKATLVALAARFHFEDPGPGIDIRESRNFVTLTVGKGKPFFRRRIVTLDPLEVGPQLGVDEGALMISSTDSKAVKELAGC